MILYPLDDGWVAVPQSAHAMLSFQLADHWGNRLTPRPSPRAEVLAAVLLHDTGWDGREEPPRLDGDGRPLAFDTMAVDERRRIWSDSATRAASRGAYVEYLVSHHASHLATCLSGESHDELVATEESRRLDLSARLVRDPRYRQVLSGAQDEVNRAVVRLCDAISVHLLLRDARVTLPALPRRDGPSSLTLSAVGGASVRLRPWPLCGRRLTVHAEGRRLAQRTFADGTSLAAAWRAATRVRLSWQLLAPGTQATSTREDD